MRQATPVKHLIGGGHSRTIISHLRRLVSRRTSVSLSTSEESVSQAPEGQ